VIIMSLYLFIQAFAMLFVILDAVGNAPIFYALTSDRSAKERRDIAKKSAITAASILFIFAFLGWYIFEFFGITIYDFEIAGGIILLLVALDNLTGETPRTRRLSSTDLAIVPLATPLYAGPGSILTVMYLMHPPFTPLMCVFSIVTNILIAWLLMVYSEKLFSTIGSVGTKAVVRIMGLIIAAMAIMFIRKGIMGVMQEVLS